jgi:hypothetical protein
MTTLEQFHGLYYYMGLVLDVHSDKKHLVAGIPGVPKGFEFLLEQIGPDLFRSIGGPIDGSTIQFIRDSDGKVKRMKVGNFEVEKITPDTLKTLPVVERLLPPKYELTTDKKAEFEILLKNILANGDGNWIEYILPYPKHEFIQFVTAQDQIIFHGSNDGEIDIFQPVRKSMELYDEIGRGNIQAVYGTHDGLWSMFFAIVDRKKQQGSIRNGVDYFQNRVGAQISVYNFSINQDQLIERPFTEGALYFLPRETFKRLQLTPESYANEWASEQPVKPFAKLHLQPEDFPFLNQIGGHDDSELIRLGKISGQIRKAALSANLDGDYFEVVLPLDAPVTFIMDEYIELQRIMMPATQMVTKKIGKGVKLTITNLPPAVHQMISDQYKDLLN